MSENKSSISNQSTYEGIGEYWDTHELDESFFEGEDLNVEIDLKGSVHYFVVDESMVDKIAKIAAIDGVSSGKLINGWIKEKVEERRLA